MALSISAISLLSVLMSILAIYLVFSIFQKVYTQKQRRPWLFIGVSAVFLAFSELLRFAYSQYKFVFISINVTEALIYILVFISMSFLAYGLLLEHLILKYYKGKFVKIKFVPVQEGALNGDLDLNISNSNSYLALKKDRHFLLEQFSKATKVGYEGFLISESNPKELRAKLKLEKTPIAWISSIEQESHYIKELLDENSGIVDPLHINDIISYIDNFLEQSSNPFILIECNDLIRSNNFNILEELFKYVDSKIKKYNGIVVLMINQDILNKNQISSLEKFLLDLE